MSRGLSVALLATLALAACHARHEGRLTYPAPEPPSWVWQLPPGFPEPAVPADNPMSAEKVELGRRLFDDPRLSGNRTQSCSSCHRPELAFTDRRARAVGSTGERHPRSAMSLVNVAYNASYNWSDPRLDTLERQIRVPLFNTRPVELGVSGREAEVLARFRGDPVYAGLYGAAFPGDVEPVTIDNTIRALASFVRTLIAGGSPYDRLVWGGEMDALSPSARRGMDLFFSERLGCAGCHSGFNLSGPVRTRDEPSVKPEFHNTGLGDAGRFRAPTLRNVAVTAPYMHDGSVATLDGVIDHYARGGGDDPRKSERLRGFRLDPIERADVLAFLHSLTDAAYRPIKDL